MENNEETEHFKFLDLVRVQKKQEGVVLLAGKEVERTYFFQGSLGRIIDYGPKGYKVFFPVPHFPDKGVLVDIAGNLLSLYRGVTEEERRAAHCLGQALPHESVPG